MEAVMETTEVKAGDIIYTSWGYEQTNIDFYMVTKANGKSVWFVPMGQKIVKHEGGMAEMVVPGAVVTEQRVYDYEAREYVVSPVVAERRKWNVDFGYGSAKVSSF